MGTEVYTVEKLFEDELITKPNDCWYYEDEYDNLWSFHLNVAYRDLLEGILITEAYHQYKGQINLWQLKRSKGYSKHSWIYLSTKENEQHYITTTKTIREFIKRYKRALRFKRYYDFWPAKWRRITSEDRKYIKYWIEFLEFCLKRKGFKTGK